MVAEIKNTKANKPARADFATKTKDLRSSCKLFAKETDPLRWRKPYFPLRPPIHKMPLHRCRLLFRVSSFPLTHATRAIICRCDIKTATRAGGRCAYVCARRSLGRSAIRRLGDDGRRLFASRTAQRGARENF